MARMDTDAYGEGTDESSYPYTSPGISATTSRRHLLQLLGAGGLASLAGCPAESDGDNDSSSDGSDTTDDTGTETQALHTHTTIGVDYGVAAVPDYSTLAFYTRAFEPLTWTTPELETKPWLASDWERTGELTWEFTLRDDVRYHNGDRLNADRVISMLEWGLSGQAALPLATPRATNIPRDGVTKVDEMTIEMETIQPTVNQAANLAIFTYFGVHPVSSLHTQDDFSNLIGTGPYRIEEVEKNQHVELSAFADYWQGAPQTDELTVRQFDDQNTLALALKSQEIDVGMELPPNQLDPIKNAEETTAETRTAPKTARVWLNLATDLFSDKSLRKALNYAVSQADVVKASQNGLGIPARGPIPPFLSISAHDDLPTYGPDTDKARSLVEQSVYSGETLDLLASGRETRQAKLITQVLQQELSEIGVEIDVQIVGINSWYERRDDGDGHLFLGENTMLAPDEPFSEALARWGSGGKSATWLEIEPEVQNQLDDLFATARTNVGETRIEALQEAQHIIMDEALQVPLYHEEYVVGMRKGITGIDWHSLSQWTRVENLKYLK